MKKTKYRLLASLLAVMLCVTAFSTTAFAYEDDESAASENSEASEIEETTAASEALTPDGNLTLEDDSKSGDKEFITVQTKDGNTFYLIIDRASDEDNVYFLNLVDEEDLLTLIDDEEFVSEYKNGAADTEDIDLEETTTPEPEVTAEPKVSEAKSSGPLLVIVLIMLLAGGAAVWFFKFRKPKPSAKSPADLDDYDFSEDEEYETETEDEPEASDAEDNPGAGDTEQ
jgi:flagellar basal body-associated protein FliL